MNFHQCPNWKCGWCHVIGRHASLLARAGEGLAMLHIVGQCRIRPLDSRVSHLNFHQCPNRKCRLGSRDWSACQPTHTINSRVPGLGSTPPIFVCGLGRVQRGCALVQGLQLRRWCASSRPIGGWLRAPSRGQTTGNSLEGFCANAQLTPYRNRADDQSANRKSSCLRHYFQTPKSWVFPGIELCHWAA